MVSFEIHLLCHGDPAQCKGAKPDLIIRLHNCTLKFGATCTAHTAFLKDTQISSSWYQFHAMVGSPWELEQPLALGRLKRQIKQYTDMGVI